MEFKLPSEYHYRGWNIRYSLTRPHGIPGPGYSTLRSVVFVHGTPWSSAVYRPVVEALLAKGSYQILVYDLPGYGQSQDFNPNSGNEPATESDFPGDTSIKLQAEALTGLLKHVKWDGDSTPAVVAHDIAGTIVLRAHLLHGCEFDSMLLADANCVLPWGDGFYKLVRSDPQPFVRLPPDIFEAVVRAVTRSAVHDPNVLQAGWEDVLARPWVSSPSQQRSFVRQIAQANDADVAEMLEGDLYPCVRCDLKVVWGEEDKWIPREKVEELIRRMSGRVNEHAFIPKAGHLVMLDQPARFAIEVFDWLARSGSSSNSTIPW